MDRLQFYYGQLLEDVNFTELQDRVESTVARITVDYLGYGCLSGLEVSVTSMAGQEVFQVAAGLAYTNTGERIYASAPLNTTAPTLSGTDSYYITVWVQPARVESDPHVDAMGRTVYYYSDESAQVGFTIGSAVPDPNTPIPPEISEGLILADYLMPAEAVSLSEGVPDLSRVLYVNKNLLA